MHSNDRLVEDELLEHLRQLEESLWVPATRFDDAYVDRIFAADFFEFGRSGQRYNRSEMFFGTSDLKDFFAEIPLREFRARYLSNDVVQVTYISCVTENGKQIFGNRSSIWSCIDGHWQLRFHQGTPCNAP